MVMSRPLLILDIDETLLFASEQSLDYAHDYQVGRYVVYKRPHVDTFLAQAAQWFDLAVWTSSSGGYAELAINPLVQSHELKFLWSRERCTRQYDQELQQEYWLKDLRKVKRLGFPLEQTLIIDDSPEKIRRHYGNHIRVNPFVGDRADSELERLLPFLDYLRTVENVRRIEKRNWRTHTGTP